MNAVKPQSDQECLLIYDGQCRFCVVAKETIEQRDEGTGARFVTYQSQEAVQRLGRDYTPGEPDVAYLLEPDGTLHRGLDAFVPLLPGVRGGRVILFLLRLPLGMKLGRFLYRIIARYRYRWFGAVQAQERP